MQGPYAGGFVYSRGKALPAKEREGIEAAGINIDEYKKIDNSCQDVVGGRGEILKREKGTVEKEEWKDLLFGEGGVGDWVRPGWRGEYDK